MALKKLLLLVVLIPLAALVSFALLHSADLRYVAAVRGNLVSLAAGGGWIAWVEREDGEARLVAVRHGSDHARVLLTAPQLSGLAVSHESAYVTRSHRAEHGQVSAELLRVDLTSGHAEGLASVPWPAEEIAAGEAFVCWREHRGPALPKVRFVAAAAPVDVIRAYDPRAADVRTLAVIPGSPGPSSDEVRLIQTAGECLYWLERRGGPAGRETLIQRMSLVDGRSGTLAREPGMRHAVIAGDAILWTTASLEAPAQRSYSAVMRLFFGDSVPHAIADWLGSSGELEASDGVVYFRERTRLWRLGDARGEQRASARAVPGAVGSQIVGDVEYTFVRTRPGLTLATRPLTWRARLLRAAGL